MKLNRIPGLKETALAAFAAMAVCLPIAAVNHAVDCWLLRMPASTEQPDSCPPELRWKQKKGPE